MASVPDRTSTDIEWTWDVARLYPPQGHWSEEEYLHLTDSASQLIEFTDGRVEFLPVPTIEHQFIVKFLLRALDRFVEPSSLGVVLFSPVRVYLREGVYREPDLVFQLAEHLTPANKRYFQGADLVMEVVSDEPDGRRRDYEQKPAEYAAAGIAEYWIADPQEEKITVLSLTDGKYEVYSTAVRGETATSKLLDGFSVDVDAMLAAAKRK